MRAHLATLRYAELDRRFSPNGLTSRMLHARHQLTPSKYHGKPVHLWTYGHAGRPILAFPTAGGYAHEWQQHGVVDTLADWIAQGRIRLYCPETNAAAVWIHPQTSLADRMARHAGYERFIAEELVPRIHAESGRSDIVTMGASVGAMYAVNTALKNPELFAEGIGLSGRYRADYFTDGRRDEGVYYSDPSAYVWNLQGQALDRVRKQTRQA